MTAVHGAEQIGAYRAGRAVPWLLFALLWFSYGWFGSWEFNPNNSTRLFAAISLAEQGDATIDEFAHLTIDKARFGQHFYLDKAPGMTLLATPVVAATYELTGQGARTLNKAMRDPGFEPYMRLRARLSAVLITGLLGALAGVALWALGRALTGDAHAALFGAVGYALGTPIWGWSTTLFGHAAVAHLWVIAIWAIWSGTQGTALRGRALVAGAALGWAVAIEYQALLGGAVIALWALTRLWRRPGAVAAMGLAAAGGLTALLAIIDYNLLAFGSVFRLGYQGVVGFDGMNQGLFGLTYPKGDVLFALLFGLRRGLIWVAPVLVFAVLGLAPLFARARGLAVMLVTLSAVVLLVNAAYVYWDGGFSTGPRHSVPAIAPLAIALAPAWARLRGPVMRAAALALLALSVAINLIIAAAEIFAPEEKPFPLWDPILTIDWARSDFRDLPGEFWGWSHWWGLALYLVVAGALAIMLVAAARRRGFSSRR